MFYMVCRSLDERTSLINYLKQNDVLAVFHYLSLHKSDYYLNHSGEVVDLPNCDKFADQLIRLPMYYDLKDEDVILVISLINEFYNGK